MILLFCLTKKAKSLYKTCILFNFGLSLFQQKGSIATHKT